MPFPGMVDSTAIENILAFPQKLKVETSNLASGHIMKIIRIGSQTDRHAHIYGEYSLM